MNMPNSTIWLIVNYLSIKVHDITVQQLAFLLPIPEVPGSVLELGAGSPDWDFHGLSSPSTQILEQCLQLTTTTSVHIIPIHHSLPSIQHQVPHAAENVMSNELRHKPIVMLSLEHSVHLHNN